MKAARACALLTGLTAALTLAACGVPPSGVIQAGPAASGIFSPGAQPASPAVVPLYFLRKGELAPYLRKVGDSRDIGGLLSSLFDGPSGYESATASTELPRLRETPKVAIGEDDIVSVQLLDRDVPPFSHLAMRQLACTVTRAITPAGALVSDAGGSGGAMAPSVDAQHSSVLKGVRVLGGGWTRTQSGDSCPGSPLQ
ncbi:hypothetical protein ACIP98_28325 [Streptomyces sp. NPDC088354]|uniref:hypothetical protein n=1 Tax=Streptomyces sp. NPDC088354 TaxID=3365856 RepID=UPI0037FF3A87